MGIHIYKFIDNSTPNDENFLWCITDKEYFQLEKCFSIFNRRTGKFFDEYGDLDFPKGTLGPLKESVEEAMHNENNQGILKALKKFHSTVTQAIQEDTGLGFYGD